MKLEFVMLPEGSCLEASKDGEHYTIIQLRSKKCEVMYSGRSRYTGTIYRGDLYQCLDFCNEHFEAGKHEQNLTSRH
jgi:hypothetical protein